MSLPRSLIIAGALLLGAISATALGQGKDDPDTPEAPVSDADPLAALQADVIILHGTNDGTGIDPKIGRMPELGEPPFSSYNSYKLLDRTRTAALSSKCTSYKLPTGRELCITLKDIVQPKKEESRRFVISTSITKPDGNTFLPLLEVNAKAGEWFFVAGQTYKSGLLVIGIKVFE